MSKFNAGTAVEVMEFDFKAFGGREGVIPEPSVKDVETFFNAIRNMVKNLKDEVKRASGIDIETISEEAKGEELKAEAIAALENIGSDLLSKQQDQLAGILANVCKQQPSEVELSQLPYRVFAEFQKWFMGEISPKAKGTNP